MHVILVHLAPTYVLEGVKPDCFLLCSALKQMIFQAIFPLTHHFCVSFNRKSVLIYLINTLIFTLSFPLVQSFSIINQRLPIHISNIQDCISKLRIV